jgi:hypothetical protein
VISSPADVLEKNVFLNVPFDRQYQPLFLALIAGLTALGREPHCVLEVPSAGQSRLDRIYGLLASCESSVHDLSRVRLSGQFRLPRFNMPFELGMAFALTRNRSHKLFVLERQIYRLQASLSDLNGLDPHIHGGTQTGVLRCILDCFGTPSGSPSFVLLRKLTARLNRVVSELQREQGLRTPFHPYMFRQVVRAAGELAQAEGLIALKSEKGSTP